MGRVDAMDLTFSHDAEGRPVAAAAPGKSSETNDLAAFLTEEVHWPHYAALLLEQAAADPVGPAATATGNAYAVTFDTDIVTIEHLHIPKRKPIRLARTDFVAMMTAWRVHLEAGA